MSQEKYTQYLTLSELVPRDLAGRDEVIPDGNLGNFTPDNGITPQRALEALDHSIISDREYNFFQLMYNPGYQDFRRIISASSPTRSASDIQMYQLPYPYTLQLAPPSSTSYILPLELPLEDDRFSEQCMIKVFRPFNDSLRDYSNKEKRHKALLIANEWNQRFNPHHPFIRGLAPILAGNITTNGTVVYLGKPNKGYNQRLDHHEYALVMDKLPPGVSLEGHLRASSLLFSENLAQSVSNMHLSLAGKLSQKDSLYATPEHLNQKFDDNLKFFMKAVNMIGNWDSNTTANLYAITALFKDSRFRDIFIQRLDQAKIKRCHGDLKASNIWLNYQYDYIAQRYRKYSFVFLDTVDFNKPEFYNIDILSDIAMLAIDIEGRLGHSQKDNKKEIDEFLNTYLYLVGENSMNAKKILAYYLIEKAMICAYMNILFDSNPDLGKRFLDILKQRVVDFFALYYPEEKI